MQPCCGVKRFAYVMTQALNHAANDTTLVLDLWLQAGLQRLYNRTLLEPIPDELLGILAQDQRRLPRAS